MFNKNLPWNLPTTANVHIPYTLYWLVVWGELPSVWFDTGLENSHEIQRFTSSTCAMRYDQMISVDYKMIMHWL